MGPGAVELPLRVAEAGDVARYADYCCDWCQWTYCYDAGGANRVGAPLSDASSARGPRGKSRGPKPDSGAHPVASASGGGRAPSPLSAGARAKGRAGGVGRPEAPPP